jgi:hypothetical protein
MRVLTLAAIAVLAACSDDDAGDQDGDHRTQANIQPTHNPSAPSEPGRSLRERRPPEEGRADAPDAQAARQALQRYFALIEADRHAEAAELWRDSGRAAAFAATLQRFNGFQPSIAAPGPTRNAAGSTIVEISLQLLGRSARGPRSLSDGIAVLRRADDLTGANAEQLVWRIDRIALQPPPVATAT